MAERNLNTALKKRLINNEAFVYAHLIKYERPYPAEKSGRHSTDAKRYAYLTDGAVNIDFNDGSLATDGTTSNGTQTYVADKIAKIGSYSETIEAKATGMTLSISAESLYNSVTATTITMTSSTITVPSSIDLVAEGFREGDKVSITGGTNNGHEVRITGIKTNNTVLTVSNIDSTLATQNTGTSITLQIVSDELKGPLLEMNDATLKSYHNRDVFVYKAFLDPDNYSIIGAPTLVFKGIIASASIKDDPSKNITVQWKLTSHWGDFAQVNGRPTNDAIHRAIDENGNGQPEVALKEIYAEDLGFAHADVTLSTMSTYKYMEKVPELRMKKTGLFKLRRKYSQVWVDEEREATVDLNWALSAKYIPVVYGVDKVDGIPIFVDTENENMEAVYIVYAICEGEIGGIYDFYFDDHPRICLNLEDEDARNTSGANYDKDSPPDVTCVGRADKGTVLGGKALVELNADNLREIRIYELMQARGNSGGNSHVGGHGGGVQARLNHFYNVSNAYNTQFGMDGTADTGILHGQTHEVDTPNNMFLTLHSGLTYQRADDTLNTIANGDTKFKRQTDYYNGPDYWGPSHMLSDTAYVVVKCTIGEGDDTVPETKYIVRGKLIDCYNYDFSYRHHNIPLYQYGGGEAELTDGNVDPSQTWNIGDTVDLYNTTTLTAGNFVIGNSYIIVSAGNTSFTSIGAANNNVGTTFTATGVGSGTGTADTEINSDVVIIDKWQIATNEGSLEWRFRFSDAPELTYVDGIPTITNFYMKKGSNKFHFVTSNHIENSGTVPSALSNTGTISISNNEPIITFGTAPTWVYDSGAETFPIVNDVDSDLVPISFIEGYDYDGNTYTAKQTVNGTILTILGTSTDLYLPTGETSVDNVDVIRTDAIQLATSASTDNDVYNGMRIKLIIIDTDGDYTIQERNITDYDGSLRVAQVDIPWDKDKFPKDPRTTPINYTNYTYKYEVLAPKDRRVSTNPSIQLLDYATSETYGKRLNLDTDIELGSWLSAARACDSRGTQTCHGTRLIAAANDRYVLTSTGAYDGNIIAMGKVKTAVTDPGSGVANSVEFEEVYGKFTKTFMPNRHQYAVGDIICNYGGYYRVGTAGTQPAATRTISSITDTDTIVVDNATGIAQGQFVFGYGITDNITVSSISGTTVNLSAAVKVVVGTRLHFCSNLTRLTSFDIFELGGGASDKLTLSRTTDGSYNDTTEYSLYNSDFIKYWRQLGWEGHHQRWATRHQLCTTLDTSNSVFNNMNGMLQQFNGILSFEAGKYALRIEAESDDTETTSDIATSSDTGYTIGTELNHRYITDDNIIGSIKVTDPGPKKSYNTVSSTIVDPGNKFEGKQVSFYDSNFLKADKNIIKSGNFAQPSIHNYYNARINVENYLKESRYQMKVSFTLGPRGLLLIAGDVISITYSKFGWSQKQFRIENLNFKTNCTVDVSASEYDDSFYSITTPTLQSNQIPDTRTPVPYALNAPTSFSVAAGVAGQIDLVWKNASNVPTGCTTEIYYADGDQTSSEDITKRKYLSSVTAAPKVTNQVNGAVSSSTSVTLDSVTGLVEGMLVRGTTALDALTGENIVTISSISGLTITLSAAQTIPDDTRLTFLSAGEYTHYIGLDGSPKTYWLRHSYTDKVTGKIYNSPYTTRKVITSVYPETVFLLTVRSNAQVFSANESSVIQSPDTIKFTATKTNLANAFVWSTSPSVNLYADISGGSPITSGSVVYLRKADMSTHDTVSVTATVTSTTAERAADADDTYTETVSIPRVDSGGGEGAAAKSVRLRSSSFIFKEATDGTVTPNFIQFDAVKQNTTANVYWQVTGDSPAVTLYTNSNGTGAVTEGTTSGTAAETVYLLKAQMSTNTDVTVTLTCDSITDTTNIVQLEENSGNVIAVLSNPMHVLPADNDGAVSDTQAQGSGTNIRLYEGILPLTYDATPEAGEWSVYTVDTANITENAITDQGTYAQVADFTGVATGTDKYEVIYAISGKTRKGDDFGTGTTATVNGAVSSSATVTIEAANTLILPGALVTGTGISGTPRVKSISTTTLTLTSAQTIADDVVLTFSPVINAYQFLTKSKAGGTGTAGTSNAIVYGWKRSSTALASTDDPDRSVTVDLTGDDAGKITTPSTALIGNGWYKNISDLSGVNPLYVIAASASGSGATDTIGEDEWTEPTLYAGSGMNAATIFLYQRTTANTAPSAGSNSTHDGNPEGNVVYTFADGTLGSFATSANGWSVTNPGVNSTYKFLWVTTATAISSDPTDTILDSEWAPIKLLTSFGVQGENAKTVIVTPSSYTRVKYVLPLDFGSGSTFYVPTLITIKAQTQNTTADGAWSTSAGTLTGAGGTGSVVNTHTAPLCTVTSANFVDGMVVTYTLATADGEGTDQVTLEELTAGTSALTAVLTNETHAMPASSTGVVSDTQAAGSGTDIKLYEGSDLLDYVNTGTPAAGQWKVVVGTIDDITEGTKGSQGSTPSRFARIPSHTSVATSVDTYTIPYTISGKLANGNDFTDIVKSQTLTKAKGGSDGDPGTNTATINLYKRSSSGVTAPIVPDNDITYTFADASISGSLDSWTTTVPTGAGQYLWTTSAQAIGTGTTDTIDANLISAGGDWVAPTVQSDALPPRQASGVLYFDAWSGSGTTATPSASAYNFSTRAFTSLTTNWAITKGTLPYAYSTFTVTEATYGGTQTITFQAPVYVGEWLDLDVGDIDLSWSTLGVINLDFGGGVGTGSVNAPNLLKNDQIEMNTDGSLNYAGSGSGAVTMNTLTDANSIRSRLLTGLTSSGIVDEAVPQGKGGTGLTSAGTAIQNNQISLTASGGTVTLNNAHASNNTFNKTSVALGNVDDTSDATTLAGNLTGTILGTTAAAVKSGAELGTSSNQDSTSNILAGNLTGTVNSVAVATVSGGAVRANTGLTSSGDVNRTVPQAQGGTGLTSAGAVIQNSSVVLSSAGVLTGAGTSAQVNIGSVAGSNFDTSGNISDGKTLTISGSADNAKGTIVVGNITIDGYNNRILITD